MKICPKCELQFEDEEEACPEHGAVLIKAGVRNNPKLPGVRTVDNNARTAMFTLEEFQKEKERLDGADNPFGDEGDETASTISPLHGGVPDRDATRALTLEQIEQMRAERDGRKAGAEPEAEAPKLAEGTIPEGAKEPVTQATAAVRRRKKDDDDDDGPRISRKTLIIGGAAAGAFILLVGAFGAYTAFFRKVTLEVVTVPPGATVLVDNVDVGIAPLKAPVKPGAHSVRARLEGYQESADVVEVPAAGRAMVVTLKKEGSAGADGSDPIAQKATELHKDAKALMDKGEFDAAEDKLRALAALVPDDNRAPEALAELARRKNAKERARSTPTATAEKDSRRDEMDVDDANIAKLKPAQRGKLAVRHLDEARTAYDTGELARAKELLSKCIRLNPRQVQCHRYLARVYTKEDNTEKVKYHLQRYLELGGNDDDYKVRDWLKSH